MTLAPWRPEVISHEMRWSTDVMISRDGTEQRVCTQAYPRESAALRYRLLDSEARVLRSRLFNDVASQWTIPLWWEETQITADVSVAGTSVSGDFQYWDWSAGDRVFLITGDDSTWEIGEIDSITSSTITLSTGVSSEYPAGSWIMPARYARLSEGQGISHPSVGITAIDLQVEFEDMVPPAGTGVSLDTYNSLTHLDQCPTQSGPTDENFAMIFDRADFGSVWEQIATEMDAAKISQQRRWYLEGAEEFQKWKYMLQTLRGRREPFYFATWQPDLELSQTATPGSSTITIVDDQPGYDTEYNDMDSHSHLQLELSNGNRIQREVDSIADNGDGTLTITLGSALPAGSYTVDKISHLELCRGRTDSVRFEHLSGGRHYVQWGVMVVQA